MDTAANPILMLCQHLISFAFQRCRVSEELCRISVCLSRSRHPNLPGVRVCISDTAVASTLEEFQLLCFIGEGGSLEKWDGVLSVLTTGNLDEEVYVYDLNLKQGNSTPWLAKLPSVAKNGVKFSGTEVCFTVLEDLDLLLVEIKQCFQKMLILNIPNITFELAVQEENSHQLGYKDVFLPNEWHPVPFSSSYIEKLKHGFELYVMKKSIQLTNNNGIVLDAAPEDHRRQTCAIMMEAVIIISDIPEVVNPCFRECNSLTKVLYFKDFSPLPLPVPCQAALRSIDWKRYGLNLESIMDQGDCAALKWQNLSPDARIDIVFHCYQTKSNFPPKKRKDPCYKNLLKEAAKLALDDLKEKHSGFLLSDNAIKVCSHAPDLARTLAGLIMSSNDIEFQGECLSLLGLEYKGIAGKVVEERIKDKLITVIEANDRKPKEQKALEPFLFADNDHQQEPNLEEDSVEGDYASSLSEL